MQYTLTRSWHLLVVRVHQEVVEESFLPTVRTLMNAPATSPLAEVDINNMVELLVELTRPSALIRPSTNTEVRNIHGDSCHFRSCFYWLAELVIILVYSHKYIFISSTQMEPEYCSLDCFGSYWSRQSFNSLCNILDAYVFRKCVSMTIWRCVCVGRC